MRGKQTSQMTFSTVSPDSRVPAGHPIRAIRALADAQLEELSPLFDEMYSSTGRPSIPPERLLKGSLLMALYTVRSERQFCERLDYDLRLARQIQRSRQRCVWAWSVTRLRPATPQARQPGRHRPALWCGLSRRERRRETAHPGAIPDTSAG